MQSAIITNNNQTDAYRNFVNSLDSQASRKVYLQTFPYFIKFCQVDSYEAMLEIPIRQLESKIRDYLIYLREDRKVSAATISLYLASITHFYEMNDVSINWKRLNRFKGKSRKCAIEDVPYNKDQIKALIDRASLRDRCMILLMASAGLRRGALTTLRLQDLQFIDKFSLYKITVYKQEQEQYVTYCTPECAKLIDQYLEWRRRLGEQLQPNSIMFRAEFDTTSNIRIAKPKPIRPNTISRAITILLDKTGLRPRAQGWKKTALMECHGLRKFFNTQCINRNMNPLYCEYLMGHKTGLMKSYFKPSDQELLEGNDKSVGYIGVIPYLTINATEEENELLRRQVETLQVEKNQIEDLQKEIKAIRELVAIKTKIPNTH